MLIKSNLRAPYTHRAQTKAATKTAPAVVEAVTFAPHDVTEVTAKFWAAAKRSAIIGYHVDRGNLVELGDSDEAGEEKAA